MTELIHAAALVVPQLAAVAAAWAVVLVVDQVVWVALRLLVGRECRGGKGR